MRGSSAVLALLAFGAASAAAASPRLLQPSPGTSIDSGSVLRIEWSGAPHRAREWEAFLSLDGGRSFPLRVTPHLEVAARSFDWIVPRLSSADARIRLRFGRDGRDERDFDLPDSFRIRPSGCGRLLTSAPRDVALRPFRGEEENLAWVEESENGDPARLVVPPEAAGLRPAASPAAPVPGQDLLRTEKSPSVRADLGSSRAARRSRPSARLTARALAVPILILSTRLNV
jgi:hypothetical protein